MGIAVETSDKSSDQAPTEDRVLVDVIDQRVVIHCQGQNGEESLDVTLQGRATPELVALAAVEVLRGRLLHVPARNGTVASASARGGEPVDRGEEDTKARSTLSEPTVASRPPLQVEPPPVSPLQGRGRSWSAELGPFVFGPTSQIPLSTGLYLSVGRVAIGKLTILSRWASSIGAASFAVEGGRMEYRVRTGILGVRYDLGMLDGRMSLEPEVGAGVLRADAESFPNSSGSPATEIASFTGAKSGGWAALGALQLGLVWWPNQYVAFVGNGGASLLSPSMWLEGITKATGASPITTSYRRLGNPVLTATLGLRVQL